MRRPRFIAEHARNAQGLLGRVIAFIMARETWAQNLRAMEALAVAPTDHVLDVGCGHGRGLATLAARASQGHVVGVDPSELMAEIAVERNCGLVRARRVDVAVAGAEDLPLPDEAFDKALCVHVIYFWKDLDAGLREIARVLKPGGRLALLCRTDADATAVQSFPPEIYTFRSLDAVVAALERAGFGVAAEPQTEPALIVATKRVRQLGQRHGAMAS